MGKACKVKKKSSSRSQIFSFLKIKNEGREFRKRRKQEHHEKGKKKRYREKSRYQSLVVYVQLVAHPKKKKKKRRRKGTLKKIMNEKGLVGEGKGKRSVLHSKIIKSKKKRKGKKGRAR